MVLINRNPQATKRKSGIRDWHLALFVMALLILSILMLFIHITLEGTVAKFEVQEVPSKEKSSVEGGVSHIIEAFCLIPSSLF
jgi:uncharacterized paraquat-inducible protein A